jgi:hypothetical protein
MPWQNPDSATGMADAIALLNFAVKTKSPPEGGDT